MKKTSLSLITACITWLLLSLGASAQMVTSSQNLDHTGALSPSSAASDPRAVIIPTPLPEPGPCPDWQPGTAYAVGDCVSFDAFDDQFICIQAHTSQLGWEPPNAPALWQRLFSFSWQPQTFYAPGVPVMFQGVEFQARQAHTSQDGWDPLHVPALWLQVDRVFAPYIDVSDPNRDAVVSGALQVGVKFLTFASINAQHGCSASWSGSASISVGDAFASLINKVRAAHGDVILSFGGASGTDLALACADAASLKTQYQIAITAYGATMVDFDVEGAVLANAAARERINIAVAGLQNANPGLTISYTLPVSSMGLTDDSIQFLANAKSHGVQMQIVNVMTRNFESSAAGNAIIDNVVQAVDHAISQVIAKRFSARLGITPMIGKNDSAGQTFTEQDAQDLLSAAQDSIFIGRLSVWSITRDQQCINGRTTASCSGIPQQPFDFSRIFAPFH